MSPERWQQIAQLFDEVLERGPDERAAFLHEACAADTELRREIESLLAARAGAGEFLNEPALKLEARQVAATQTALPTGQQIAHFQVLAPLGAGAMGEVYLARDTRLARNVALKVLPERFTQDASRLRRFEREARAASSLNHQNIIIVFEVGQDGPRHYIAAEFIEGVTLRKHLAAGPLPLAEALDIASQIAAALKAAHQAGIVHRDIKPENVMVRPDGVVKVLDFGIAKLTEQADAGAPLSRGTEQGTVIGTPGYMSPEQARGLDVDARTDIFSLGVVLYEMIAGELPFRGTTQADAVVALLELEPARLSSYNPAIAPALDRLAAKLLAKERGERYATIAELRRDLQTCQPSGSRFGITWRKAKQRVAALTGVSAHARPNLARASRNNRFLLVASLLGVVSVAGLGWLLYRSSQKPEVWAERSQLHSARFLSRQLGTGSGLSRPVFSPNGQEVAYSLGEEAGKTSLWIKSLAREQESRITDGQWKDMEPVWSPDGQKLAFLSNRAGDRDLWMFEFVPPSAGRPTLLRKLDFFKTNNTKLLAWAKDQQREWIYLEAQNNLFAVDPISAELRQVTQLEKRERDAYFSLAPDLDRVVYLDKLKDDYCLMLKSLRSDETTALLRGTDSYRSPVWFPDGRKIALLSNHTGTYQVYVLWLADRRLEQVTFSNDDYLSVAVAPDGNRLAVKASQENGGIYAWDFGSQTEAQYFSGRGTHVLPQLSPAGDRLLFQSGNTNVDGEVAIFNQPATPNEPAARLTDGYRGRWAPNGASVAFLRGPANKAELWRLNLQDQTRQRLASGLFNSIYTSAPYNLDYAEYCWSPDSARLVYNSRQPSDLSNLWQVAADGTPPVKLTDNADKLTLLYSPLWLPEGDKLVYLTRSQPATAQQPNLWRLYLRAAGASSILFEHKAGLRILGWLAASGELLITAASGNELELLRINCNDRQARPRGKVRTDYTNSLALARDGRQLALAVRRHGRDNLELVEMGNGAVKALTNNLSLGTRYGSLHWAADGRRLFYSKQEHWHDVLLITKKPAE